LSDISTPIHDYYVKAGVCSEQSCFVCFATNADDKFEATFLSKPSLSLYFRQLHFDEELLRARRLFLKVIRFDLPERARGQLQRVEALPIHVHIPTGEGVARHLVGAFVVRVMPAKVARQGDGLASRVVFFLGEGGRGLLSR
jgi:hypothetical protein